MKNRKQIIEFISLISIVIGMLFINNSAINTVCGLAFLIYIAFDRFRDNNIDIKIRKKWLIINFILLIIIISFAFISSFLLAIASLIYLIINSNLLRFLKNVIN